MKGRLALLLLAVGLGVALPSPANAAAREKPKTVRKNPGASRRTQRARRRGEGVDRPRPRRYVGTASIRFHAARGRGAFGRALVNRRIAKLDRAIQQLSDGVQQEAMRAFDKLGWAMPRGSGRKLFIDRGGRRLRAGGVTVTIGRNSVHVTEPAQEIIELPDAYFQSVIDNGQIGRSAAGRH